MELVIIVFFFKSISVLLFLKYISEFVFTFIEILASYNEDIYLFSNSETDSSKYLHRYRGHRNSQTSKQFSFHIFSFNPYVY